MNILAFDTSTDVCTVALQANGKIYSRTELTPRKHTECVLPWCDELLLQAGITKSQLNAIAVGIGPGAFTGVRLAVSLAQGMALALNIPVVPVSSLASIAKAQRNNEPIAVIMDARMGECYVGFYQMQHDVLCAVAPEQLCAPEDVRLPFATNWRVIGSGLQSYAHHLPSDILSLELDSIHIAQPCAVSLLEIACDKIQRGLSIAPEKVEPTYLRDKVALTIAERALK